MIKRKQVVFLFAFAVYPYKFFFFSFLLSTYIKCSDIPFQRKLAEKYVLAFNKEDDKWVFFQSNLMEIELL